MSPSVDDKSQIVSPYKCKNDETLAVMQKTLDKVDNKIDLLIETNKELAIQRERLHYLEQKMETLSTRLWYIAGGTILAIITALMKFIN